jgi:circadian clock protein KaiB
VRRKKNGADGDAREPRKNGKEGGGRKFLLRLYVTGQTPRSIKSIDNLRQFCEKHLRGRYEIEVIDIYQQPGLAAENQIIAAPTLIKRLPLPLRRLVGDFSNQDRVLSGLDLTLA